jgi:hypothetical protein
MDTYEVIFMFNGSEHRIDVPAVSAAEAAFKVGQHANPDAEFRSAKLVNSLDEFEYVGCHRAE